MSFTTYQYYILLTFTAILYFNLPTRFKNLILLAASYFFYLSFELRYVFFILTTTVVSYTCALIMSRSNKQVVRTSALALSLMIEISLLGLTKYWNPVAQSTGWFRTLDILIPLGISFYTFQTIGYLFDVYRKQLEVEKNFARYALFLSFFPHLLSGPIEPARHFLPQLHKDNKFDQRALALGAFIILLGLFKKFVIADHLAPIVNLVFDEPEQHKGLAIALGLFLARYQIYGDFSGYTDIALGSAKILGFQLSPNFNRPFFSTSITEYWRRWHMSLGIWIRQYIFYPLVSTPFSFFGVQGLTLLTFLILGLWHGGTLNFMIYGCWHGLFIILDSKTKNLRQRFYTYVGLSQNLTLLNTLSILATFFLIVVPPTLFFRSTSFPNSLILLNNMFSSPWNFSDLEFILSSLSLKYNLKVALIAILGLEIMHWLYSKYRQNIIQWSLPRFWTCTVLLGITIVLFGYFVQNTKFIYNQF